ncbi:MAG TPA: phage holin family protein, partial [Myxococcaceae bacterium]
GAALFLAPAGLAIALMPIVFALAEPRWLVSLILGLVVLGAAVLLGLLAVKRLPKQPLSRTRDRLKLDWILTKEELQ